MVEDLHKVKYKNPPTQLLAARRTLEELREVEILEDFYWDPKNKKWVLLCSIHLDISFNENIAKDTLWFVLVDSEYPLGDIEFYPSKQCGIKLTFPHQSYNGEIKGQLWTTGKLCLDTTVKVLGRHVNDEEPKDSSSKLLWHFLRAVEWIKLASKNELQRPGDFFELPVFPSTLTEIIAYSESPVSLDKWMALSINYGIVELIKIKNTSDIYITKEYRTIKDNKLIYKPSWGDFISNSYTDPLTGLWVLLKDVPVMAPWHVPLTWGELKRIILQQEIDLFEILRENARYFRDGKNHILMLGFPIPEKVQGDKVVLNWQSIKLPILSWGNNFFNGFRKGEKGYWMRDKTKLFCDIDQVQWLKAENWHRNEILNRGKLSPKVSYTSILLIGAGALGSVVSEQLVRAGQQDLTIIDKDTLQVGNLVRHILGMDKIGENKALALAEKLNSSIPHSKVLGIDGKFPEISCDKNITSYNVILDCTGEDEIIYQIERIEWEKPRIFISASLGFKAKRLFFYVSSTKDFKADNFFELVKPWLDKEKLDYEQNDFPREGIGCWHPVFPARIDDIYMMSSVVIKNINFFINNPPVHPTLIVYEQNLTGEFFGGIKMIHKEARND